MDAGAIATIAGIAILIVLQLVSFVFGHGKLTQRVKSCETVLFEDGLVEKLNECKISMTRVETKQDMLLLQLQEKTGGDKLP